MIRHNTGCVTPVPRGHAARVKPPARVKKIQMHQVQSLFKNSESRLHAFCGGINTGKSWIGAYDLVTRAKPGRLYMVLAPTFPMLRDAAWRAIKAIAEDLGYLASDNKSEMRIVLGNGAEILGRSADEPDRLRGPNLSGVWMDEAGLMSESILNIMLGRLREGGELGWLSATFTPNGKRHWTYREFALADDAQMFHCRSADNPFAPKGFVDSLKSRYSAQFARQELEGLFVEIDGEEFSALWFEEDTVFFEQWPQNLALKTMALDPSKGKSDKVGDFSSYVKLGINHEDMILIECDIGRRPIPEMISTGVDLYLDFQPHVFGVESNAWQDLLAPEFAREFRQRNVIAPDIWEIYNHTNKLVRIRRLAGYLSHNRVRFKANSPGTQMLIDQFLDFPKGPHDDGPDSMEMAIRLAEELTKGA